VFESLRPRRYYEAITAVDPAELVSLGIRGLILDLDNTMIPRHVEEVPDQLDDWLASARDAGLRACIVSNNFKARVAQMAERLGLPLVARAAKPRRKAFLLGMDAVGTGVGETAVIGDQLFTDVLGGNRMGLYTILVVPLPGPELPHTSLLRRIERRLLRRWMQLSHLELEPGSTTEAAGS